MATILAIHTDIPTSTETYISNLFKQLGKDSIHQHVFR